MLEAISPVSFTFPLCLPLCIATYLMKWNMFSSDLGKVKGTRKAECHPDSVTPASTAHTGTGCWDREHLGSQGTFSGLFKGAGVVQSCLSDNWNIPSAQEVQLQMIDGRVVPGYFFFPFQTVSVKVLCLGSLLVISSGMKC